MSCQNFVIKLSLILKIINSNPNCFNYIQDNYYLTLHITEIINRFNHTKMGATQDGRSPSYHNMPYFSFQTPL